MEWFLTLSWKIWNFRNDWVMQRKRRTENMVVEWIAEYFNEFRGTLIKKTPIERDLEKLQSWPPPLPHLIAVSVDAAVDNDATKSGAGCVIRDHNGHLLARAISAT